jgi:hypothetical protein
MVGPWRRLCKDNQSSSEPFQPFSVEPNVFDLILPGNSTHPAAYLTGLNVGRSGLACSGLASVTTSAGLVMNQSTPAIARMGGALAISINLQFAKMMGFANGSTILRASS